MTTWFFLSIETIIISYFFVHENLRRKLPQGVKMSWQVTSADFLTRERQTSLLIIINGSTPSKTIILFQRWGLFRFMLSSWKLVWQTFLNSDESIRFEFSFQPSSKDWFMKLISRSRVSWGFCWHIKFPAYYTASLLFV